ncbi:hypothetical protein ACH6CV_02290 [Bacillota bacterium Meth-B3]
MRKNIVVLLVLTLLVLLNTAAAAYVSPGKMFDWEVYGNEAGHHVATLEKEDTGQQWRVKIKEYTRWGGPCETYFNIRNQAGTRMSKARLFIGAQDKTTSYQKTAKEGKKYTLTCEIKDSTLVGPPAENFTSGHGLWSP